MFRQLRIKLTVLYAALFGVALLVVSIVVYSAISSNAQSQVRSELTASGTVFDRIWSLRSDQLHEGAALLSRDFGFREAVASGDAATIISAMENLRARFDIDLAFIVNVDGRVFAKDAGPLQPEADALITAFYDLEDPSGVAVIGGQPYQMIAAPILSPDLTGWVVFAARLDRREMRALEQLSAIPLDAAVMHRDRQRIGWMGESAGDPRDRAALDQFIDTALKEKPAARNLATAQGDALALVKPLPSLTGDHAAVLVLRYPLARALAPYRALLASIVATGLFGLAVVVWGSWALARSLTRPISALDDAARRLQRGEDAHVTIETADEIGRLAASFNQMATEIRERERRITHLALHDEETGLPNRLALERAVEVLPPGPVFVAALGVERFAHVRGAIGYALAAQAMRMIANRLAGLAPEAKTARLSTDVLGFILAAPDEAAAQRTADRLLRELEHPLKVGGDAIDVALSVGLTAHSAGEESASEVVERANIALDQARGARRKIAFFDAEAYGDPASNLSLMSSMLEGIKAGDLTLFHQPKFDLRRREVTGVEALARWRHPTRGLLPPDLFIPMAEETGHIRTLTDWVLRQAIADQKTFARAGHELEMSVNISGRLLGDMDFARFAVAETRKARGRICFEITETAVIENPELALSILDRFAEAGIVISIDDFGSGLSSLAYLKQIRGQELKLDKSIVMGVGESQRDALIVRAAIDMAHSLGLKVTAEGVETSDVLQLLSAMGCDCAQGYLIAKPQPLKELLTFLNEDQVEMRSYG